ncbi:MAG: chromate transporter [Oscillospiraceae bacterium]|nr:chromate transporter [Oscillospiraceae bacterium]
MNFLNLIIEFFKIGLLAIGGGLATIPFLRETAQRYDWFTEAELVDMIAVAESVPGPLGVNIAAYAGFNAAGVLGVAAASLSLVLPSVVIILLISRFLKRFGENRIAGGVFQVLRPAATGLIAGALLLLLFLTLTDEKTQGININSLFIYAVLTAACFAAEYIPKLKKIKIHPAAFIAVGAACGLLSGL